MTISDIEQRIFSKLDKLDDSLRGTDGLCNRMTKLETVLTNHLDSQERKFNKSTIVIGIVISVIGLVAIFK